MFVIVIILCIVAFVILVGFALNNENTTAAPAAPVSAAAVAVADTIEIGQSGREDDSNLDSSRGNVAKKAGQKTKPKKGTRSSARVAESHRKSSYTKDI